VSHAGEGLAPAAAVALDAGAATIATTNAAAPTIPVHRSPLLATMSIPLGHAWTYYDCCRLWTEIG